MWRRYATHFTNFIRENDMAHSTTLGGNPVQLNGDFPKAGQAAPAFSLVSKDLKDITLDSFGSKRKVLNIVPSLDTPTCAASERRFNQVASGLDNAVVITSSADLPFGMARFCSSEGLDNVINLSVMRGREFLRNYGVEIASGVLAGLAARAVIVLDGNNVVRYTELVSEIKNEPNYDAALAALQAI